MDFWGKSSRSGEDDEQETQPPPTSDRFFSSSSSSSASYHHQHHQPEQQQPPPYHYHHGGLLLEVGKPATNYEEEGGVGRMIIEREHMFDKVVTPSDVGKLNRLVIPKQHAERFFPLDSSNNDKGLQLNFEDGNGKMWRFRYSYWNSSQSYVMTKGWNRFVKEKKLDAGDIVSFQRGVGATHKDRLFIDWRRRVNAAGTPPHLSFSFPHHNLFLPWNPLVFKSQSRRNNSSLMIPPPNYTTSANGGSRSVIYFRSGGGGLQQQPPPPPPAQTPSGKRLRLFGVNMDCPFSDDENNDPPTESSISMGHYSNYVHSPPPPVMPPSLSPPPTSIPYFQLSPHGEGNECNDESRIIQSSSANSNIIARSPASSSLLLSLPMPTATPSLDGFAG
ncbi:hypothetical protein LXL04_029423 [Taraxacum kok-saghyz]